MVPVLLLHGSGPGTTAAAWAPLIEALAPTHRVIAPDLFGFGDSQGVRPLESGGLRSQWTEQVADVRQVDLACRGNDDGVVVA